MREKTVVKMFAESSKLNIPSERVFLIIKMEIFDSGTVSNNSFQFAISMRLYCVVVTANKLDGMR